MTTGRQPEPGVVDAVREHLARQGAQVTPARVAEALRDQGRPVGDATVLAVHDRLSAEVLGAGPLEPLLRTPGVTDVLVNGPDAVYLDRGEGLELTAVRFPDDTAVRRLAQRLAAAGGRRLDDATPYVDLRLPDGTRFHAVLAPVARPGTSLSLRVPRRRVFTLDELVEAGSLDPPRGRPAAPGGGRPALLPRQRRHRHRQDHAALRAAQPGRPAATAWCWSRTPASCARTTRTSSRLEARPANVEGAGEVPMRVLVRQALRMRPDRLVVGEVRGAEVTDLLAALNTGHEGGCGTLHANSAADVPARIEALAMAAGLPQAAVHSQLASAVDVVVHLSRDRAGRRRLGEVAVLERGDDGTVRAVAAARVSADGSTHEGPAAPRLGRLLDSRSGR